MYHAEIGMNNQDCGFQLANVACIADGCSEGKNSEVGAKLFCKCLFDYLAIDLNSNQDGGLSNCALDIDKVLKIFEKVLNFIAPKKQDYSKRVNDIRNNMLFTILLLIEDRTGWDFYICGDGYLIVQDVFDRLYFHEIDHQTTPLYLAYAYLKEHSLDLEEETYEKLNERPFKYTRLQKQYYSAVGIASDGLRYIIGSEDEEEFKKLLLQRKPYLINRFINKKNYQIRKLGGNGFFKDDITIVMR